MSAYTPPDGPSDTELLDLLERASAVVSYLVHKAGGLAVIPREVIRAKPLNARTWTDEKSGDLIIRVYE